MKFKKSLLLNLAIAILVPSLILLLSQGDLFKRLELDTLDLSFRLRGSRPFNKHIVIIEITDEDIARIGRWPWQRSWLAAITKALTELGAKSIFFDFVLSEPSPDKEDALFEEAIKQSQRVYLPFVFQDPSFDIRNSLQPIPRFAAHMSASGSINIYPDIDGIIRKTNLLFSSNNNLYPSAAFKIAADYKNLSFKEINPRYLLLEGEKEEIKIPFYGKNTLLINWLGKWQNTFKHYSFLEVLRGYQDFKEKKLPAIDLLDFKNSICLVGLTAIGLYDIKAVPMQPEYPGIGVTATAISNILDKSFINPAADWINILLLYLLCLIPAFLIRGSKPFEEILSIFAVGLLYFYVNYILFGKNVLFNLFTPLFGLFTTHIIVSSYNFFRISSEKQKLFKMSVTDGLTGLYNVRYFNLLLETEITLSKMNTGNSFCIVMCDIDNFKKFNDTYGHPTGDFVIKNVASALRSSVRSSDIVARYGGEEMIVLLRGTSLKDGLLITEKMRKILEILPLKEGNNVYSVTASFGLAVFKAGDDISKLIKRADESLYLAKKSGRNRVATLEENNQHA